MPTKPPSWKKVREVRRQENFVGRADQLKVFADNFTGDVPRYMAFAVTGEGGVGKSTLLLQYEAAARAHASETIVITCDDRHPSPVTAMGYIAAELEKHRFVRKDFEDRYKKYRELRQELESDAKVPRPLVNLLSMGVTDLAIKSLRKVPGAGVFFEYADERAAGEAFAQLINFGIDRWGNKDEVKLLREPESDLTPLFLGLLGDASAVRRVVLMFDVFERTADTLAPWLLNLFRFEYGEFNTNVTFVISGRDALEQHWTELAGDLCRVALEPFTLDETRQYLSNRGITDEPVVAQIHADTGGLPVLVELLAATNPQPGVPLADISQDAVKRFLWWTPEEVRQRVALLAAVPRQFNKDILSAALGADVGGQYNWLAAQSYIRTNTERGSFYHEKVRELMLRYLRSTTPGELAATHHRLADYFANAQAQLGFTDKAAYDSETWRRLEEARVYHTISAEPDRDIVVAANAFLHAFRWRWRFAENIGQVCRQVSEETKLLAAVDMAATLLVTYNAYDRDDYAVVIEQLGKLDAAASLTPSARCVIFARRGETYRRMGQHEQALADFDRAIALDEKYAWAIASRGETYRRMGQHEQALADFDRSIVLDAKYAWAIASRGKTYRALSRFDDALADLSRAIELEPDLEWAIALRGATYLELGEYAQALADSDRAIALDETDASMIALRGAAYLQIGEYAQALADFDRAIALDDTDASMIALRGAAYLQIGEYAQALADFDRAIEIDPDNAGYLGGRSRLYWVMGRLNDALADIQHAIDIAPQDSMLLALQSLMQMQMGLWEPPTESPTAITDQITEMVKQLQPALEGVPIGITQKQIESLLSSQGVEPHTAQALVSRVLETWTGDPTTLARALGAEAARARGLGHLKAGNPAEALVDFTQAIELDPSNASNLARRGRIYRQQGDYARALADYDRAIEIDPENAGYLGERSGLYLAMGRLDNALTDIQHAIDIEPQDSKLMAAQSLLQMHMGLWEPPAESPTAITGQISEIAKQLQLAFERVPTGIAQGQIESFLSSQGVEPHTAQAQASRWLELFTGDPTTLARALGADAARVRGLDHLRVGNTAEALVDFTQSIELDPSNASNFAIRGQLYRQQGDYARALADYDRAIALNEKYAWAIASRGQTYRALSRFDDAIANLSRAIDLKPDLDWAIRERGETYRQMGQYEQALADFDRAIGLDSSDWRLYGRALIRRALGQDEPASADLRAAIAEAQKNVLQSPNDWRNKLNLAVYYVAAGDRPAAEHLYQAAIDDTIGEDLIREAMRDLDDYLLLFPDDETAGTMRARLQQYLDGRRTGSA